MRERLKWNQKSVPLLGAFLASAAFAQSAPQYSAGQAERGRATYTTFCAACHGPNLGGGQFGPPLRGVNFRQRWAAQPVADLFEQVRNMPPGAGHSQSDAVYADVLALVLSENGIAAGDQALPADLAQLQAMVMPGQAQPGGRIPPGGGITPGYKLPFWPTPANPLDVITPVTDALLTTPPPGSWLQWRRTWDAKGFSPLDQVNKSNVANLRVAWSLALPPGPNNATPLVHDGVIFVHAYRDNVLALNARTGELLWQYSRQLPQDIPPSAKRNLALYGDKVYVATSDVHLVALDVKTGAVVWDKPIGDYKSGLRMTGGPLAAQGRVMLGTIGRQPGGPYISGFDAQTGEETWRFHTVARPGEPGGNTWNDLPLEARSGGSVWTAGYYDPVTRLAFFGAAPTYDTKPLRDPVRKRGVTNDALYTDATLALDPDTGKLKWHYQHMQNDQWDLDWIFERQLIELPVNGRNRRLVLTGGKIGVFDAMDAATGEYVFSFDAGLQNLVTKIDPKTGRKTIDASLVPGDGTTKVICPHAVGGKNWVPSAYNEATKLLYLPLLETCMSLTPTVEGETGILSTGVRWSIQPRPDTDGRIGRLQAINVQTGQTVWTERQRAPQSSGLLATAGGLVFAGAMDRFVSAYDDASGQKLWQTQLTDVPSAAPISYMVDGKQYVAVVAGFGSPYTATLPVLTPEIAMPVAPSSSIWVFALP